MTVVDQIKILDRKIKQNEAQYDLDRKAAKISALLSNNLEKYEYLTSEDLDLKPSTVEKARFEYFPLGNFFNKGLKEEDKKEGLLKRLKNIEDKNEEQLKETEDQEEFQTTIISENKIKALLFKSIYSQKVNDGRIDGYEAKKIFKALEDVECSKIDYSELVYRSNKKDVLKNAEALYNGLKIIADAFENRIFESEYRSETDVNIDLTPDSNTFESHGLTEKELKMFKKLFGYKNPMELRQTLIETFNDKYNELLRDLNIKLAVLKDQINTNTGVLRTR